MPQSKDARDIASHQKSLPRQFSFFRITMAIAFQDQEDAAKLLESLASAVRRGDITSTEH